MITQYFHFHLDYHMQEEFKNVEIVFDKYNKLLKT